MNDMTETASSNEFPETDLILPEERTVLLQRARVMGLRVSPNAGVDVLKAKIRAALESEKAPSEEEEERQEMPAAEMPPAIAANRPVSKGETKSQKRARLMRDAMKLVRIRITCLNPNKKDLPGEIFTIGNRYIGTVRKYVPFGDQTENGYHVPYCIYEHLKSAKFLHIRTSKTKRDGVEEVKTGYVPEFAIEVLPQLTAVELRRLALQQAAAAGKVDE